MDSELAVAYLHEFHQQTKDKNTLPRVLMVDGHASHCGLAFLNLAVALNIFIVSYPPHTTHALQGLDVVVFSSLKHHWQVIRDARERNTGIPVKKEDFIALYSQARTATLSAKLIIKAFEKTGAHPINRNAITAEQMAPSYETSLQTIFPAHLTSPVKAVLAAHHTIHTASQPAITSCTASVITHSSHPDTSSSLPLPPAAPSAEFDPALYSPSKRALRMDFLLGQTSANYLVAMPGTGVGDVVGAIPDAVYERPEADLYPDWSILRAQMPLLGSSTQKAFANRLLTEIGRAKVFSGVLESALQASNAQLVLAHLEITRLRLSLHETKALGRTKNSRAKLMSSGAARLLTSEAFRAAIERDEEVMQAKVVQREVTAKSRTLSKARKEWRAKDVADRKAVKAADIARWEEAVVVAKRSGQKGPSKPKPPVRPKTPDDGFFLGQVDECEYISVGDISGDEDEED